MKMGVIKCGVSGSIIITHCSTASLIKMEKNFLDEESPGELESVTETMWFEYSEFEDLYKAIVKAKENELSFLFNKK
jgi:hypothetical protein